MIRRYITMAAMALAAAAMAGSPEATGSITARDIFARAPREVLPLFDRNTRLDMIDYFVEGLPTASRNVMEGSSRITRLTPALVSVEATDASVYDIAMLPYGGGDTVVAVVRTFALPQRDSEINFFTTGWKYLQDKAQRRMFAEPRLEDWRAPGASKADVATLKERVPFVTATYSLDPDARRLVVRHTLKDYFAPADYEAIAPLMADSIVYEWNAGRGMFRRISK